MDQIFITDLLCRGVIGLSERERAQMQDILVNVVLFVDIAEAARLDSVDQSANYRTVAKNILAHVEKAGRYTVEALATDLAKICLAEPGVVKARVRVEKPGAVRFSASVGVEIERTLDDFKE